MEYIRVKISDGDLASSQIMTETQFEEWSKTHLNAKEMWSKCRDGLSVSFSKVKKSPLLTTKK